MLLLRLGASSSAWEDPIDLERFCRIQFPNRTGGGLDLSPSVYELEDATRIVQTHAEHQASCKMSPQRQIHLDLEGLIDAVPSPREPCPFEFIRLAHREAQFGDPQALADTIAKAIEEADRRRYGVEKPDIKGYLQARRDAADPEWRVVFEADARWGKMAGPPVRGR